MFKIICSITGFVFITLLLIQPINLTTTVFAAEKGVYISEINYAGSTNTQNCKRDSTSKTTCANDKWIEIYNASDAEINLKGWKIGVGKRKEDPTKFASSFGISGDLIIPSKGYGVLLNSDKTMISTLELSGVKTHVFGSLFGISNNTAGSKYLRVALLNNDVVVSARNIENLDELEKTNQITQSSTEKHSIFYTDYDSEPKFSINNMYFAGNHASPLSVNNLPVSKAENPVVQENTLPAVVSDVELPKVEISPIIDSSPKEVDSLPTQVIVNPINKEAVQESPRAKNNIPEASNTKIEQSVEPNFVTPSLQPQLGMDNSIKKVDSNESKNDKKTLISEKTANHELPSQKIITTEGLPSNSLVLTNAGTTPVDLSVKSFQESNIYFVTAKPKQTSSVGVTLNEANKFVKSAAVSSNPSVYYLSSFLLLSKILSSQYFSQKRYDSTLLDKKVSFGI